MFERRLRVLLIVMFVLMTVLLGRAVQLQVVDQAEWTDQAATLSQRRLPTETTRGRILDVKGHPIAVDEPCIDAWVEYGAIAEDEDWVKDTALRRLATTQPGVYRKASAENRKVILAAACEKVLEDLDRMWVTLAQETGQEVENLENARHAIKQRVLMRERFLQYQKFENATEARKTELATAEQKPAVRASWIQRILSAGTSDQIDLDHFEFDSEEQRRAHAVVRNIKHQTYTNLAKNIDSLPGLILKQGAARRYPFGKAGAHLLGHLGVVEDKDLAKDENKGDDLRKYQPTDLIGRGGIEQLAEPSLRGTRGYIQYPAGRRDEIVHEETFKPGRDVRTTIDIELQAQVQAFFEKARVPSNLPDDKRTLTIPMHGAAVILDVASSQVRAMASYPDFDANEVVENFAKLATDWNNAPLFNRATHNQFEPGSTVKPVVGLGAITDGFLPWTRGIECTGYLIVRGKQQPRGRCWTHSFLAHPDVGPAGIAHHKIPIAHRGHHGNADGFLCFADAIERSCNVYFETVADMMGPEKLAYWFSQFGLGHETGLGIAEARGSIPGPEARVIPSITWFSAIGQSHMLATPIQMANVTATIARSGIWMKPKLVIADKDTRLAPVALKGGRVLPEKLDLKLNTDAVTAAHDGMKRVVNNPAGSGYHQVKMDELLIAGKTGTAEAQPQWVCDDKGRPVRKPGGKEKEYIELERATFDHPTKTPWYRGWGPHGEKLNHSWFVGYAPADNPQIAIAVMIEHGGAGGQAAGMMAKQIFTACAEHGYLKFAK